MFREKRSSRKEELKTVRVTTKEHIHTCTEDCFKRPKKRELSRLEKIDLGQIYQDAEGRCYKEWNDGEWLQVTGVEFVAGPGGLHLMFIPKEQLHIHSRGGRTVARTTKQDDDPGNEDYHAEAATRILLQQNKNLKETRNFLTSKAAEIIPCAPKTKRPTSGRGHGAPGVPRSLRGRRIIDLISEGKPKPQVMVETIAWVKDQGENVAGPFKTNIKRHVNRLWKKSKSCHK